MTFLAPWNMVIAASIAVPALLMLYMLRLRRRRLKMSSTLLWTGSVRDLEGNVPFQMVRPSWMFLLQVLALLLLLLAMGNPVRIGPAGPAAMTVIAVDTSASMSIRSESDPDGRTRFDRAMAEADRIARNVLVPGSGREVMIVALGARPRLVRAFDQRAAPIRAALAELEPTDAPIDVPGSLRFIQSLLRGIETGQTIDVVVLSDGSFEAARAEAVAIPGRVRLVNVAADDRETVNVGVVAIGARRDARDPERVQVIATFASDAREQIDTLAELLVDGRVAITRSLRVGGAQREQVKRFDIALPGPGTVTVRHRFPDALSADDAASVIMARPRRPSVAIVHAADQPDPWLRRLLEDADPEYLRIVRAPDDAISAEIPAEGATAFDLVIFDRVAPEVWPTSPVLVINAGGPDLDREDLAQAGARRVLAWDRSHPLLRHAVLDDLVFTAGARTIAPADARVIATDADGAVLFVVRRAGAEHIVLNFSPGQSTWPADVSFAVFGRNLLDVVAGDGYGAIGRFMRTGDVVEMNAESDRIELRGPAPLTIRAIPGEVALVPSPPRVGVYDVGGARGVERIAVNLLSREETIAPIITSESGREMVISAPDGIDARERTGRPMRRWLLLAACMLLVGEWFLYLLIHRR